MKLTIESDLLIEIAEKFETPTFVYDANKITAQFNKLDKAFDGFKHRIFYACKSLTNINIIKHVYNIGGGIDCSSINEVKLALFAGVPPKSILYTSNGISFSEIEEAQSLGVHINIDSLSNLEKFGIKYGHTYPVGLRLRPNIMAGGNIKISTGHTKSKFGIPIEQIEAVHTLKEKYHLQIKALHIHTGSDIKDAEIFLKGIETLKDIIGAFAELEVIDLGGGFKVPYKPNDYTTDVEAVGDMLRSALQNVKTNAGNAFEIWFEPGKYLVSECGYFIAEVNVLKDNPGVKIAGLNTGLNHLIRPMMYDAYHHVINLTNPNGSLHKYMITGNICETDTFATDREIAELREGDLVVFFNAGAYCFEMSSRYNSRYRPAEVLVKDDEVKLIRRRETFEDLLEGVIVLSR